MQKLLKEYSGRTLTEQEKKDLYLKLVYALCNPDMKYYCVLDPNRIIDGTSIPYVGKINGKLKAFYFSKKEYAEEWCEHYNIKYKNKPLVGELTFAEFYKYLAIALINKTGFLSVDEGQCSVDMFIPDLFNGNQISFLEEIIMPRAEIL